MRLASEEKTGLTSANGVAIIPGESAKRIIVNAHADGYFQAGDDNASGFAVLLGLARYFAKQPPPKHTLMFVASGGHHSPGNGPAALVAAHPELKDNTLLIINLEHVAYLDIVRGKTRAVNNTGMTWETSVTESAKAVGVTNESPFLVDLWSVRAALLRRRDVPLGGSRRVGRSRRISIAWRPDDADDPVGDVLSLVRRRARGGAGRRHGARGEIPRVSHRAG